MCGGEKAASSSVEGAAEELALPDKKELKVVDLDELFGDCDCGITVSEDGFSMAAGKEEL